MKNFLQNLKSDFPASIVVFFVALPLCLGIALASGAPLFSGIIAGIVGGIVVGSLSGSRLGVSGPAAGLAVIVLGYIIELGSMEAFLVAVVLAGVIQVIAGYCRLGTVAYYFPSSVIKGMLTGIGLLIIIKQIPRAIGYHHIAEDESVMTDVGWHSFLTEINNIIHSITPNVVIITLISMMILIFWEEVLMKKHKIFKTIPGPLIAVIAGIILSNFLLLDDNQIVKIPVSSDLDSFVGQFILPDFTQLLNIKVYSIALVIALIASIETLLCVEATDKLDPEKRVTPTNRELKAQGVGNIISGLFGGLPITQVVVRSSANINFGAKSKTSTILHGFLLLISAITIPNLLNMIPLATLACILLVVGYKLAKPEIFKKMYELGNQQFVPFMVTIIAMIFTNLLVGVGLGIVAAICYILYYNFRDSYRHVEDHEGRNNNHLIKFYGEVSFLNKGRILKMLNHIPQDAEVTIDATKSNNIDYDIVEIIQNFKTNAKTKNIKLEIKGINFKTI